MAKVKLRPRFESATMATSMGTEAVGNELAARFPTRKPWLGRPKIALRLRSILSHDFQNGLSVAGPERDICSGVLLVAASMIGGAAVFCKK